METQDGCAEGKKTLHFEARFPEMCLCLFFFSFVQRRLEGAQDGRTAGSGPGREVHYYYYCCCCCCNHPHSATTTTTTPLCVLLIRLIRAKRGTFIISDNKQKQTKTARSSSMECTEFSLRFSFCHNLIISPHILHPSAPPRQVICINTLLSTAVFVRKPSPRRLYQIRPFTHAPEARSVRLG